MSHITLDPEFGLNPSVGVCFVCLKDREVILFGLLRPSQRQALESPNGEAPRKVCLSTEPCAECRELMGRGVILISVDDAKSTDRTNPYRTGAWIVVTDDYIKRAFGRLAESILESRLAFVPDEVWDASGLPRGSQHAEADARRTTVLPEE